MTNLDNNVYLEMLEAHSIDEPETILCTDLEPGWMVLIMNYLKIEALPTDSLTPCKVK